VGAQRRGITRVPGIDPPVRGYAVSEPIEPPPPPQPVSAPPPDASPTTITLPHWVRTDWGEAVRIATAGLLALVVVGVVATGLIALGLTVAGPGVGDQLAEVLTGPLQVMLGYLGGLEAFPVLATGLVHLFFGLVAGARRSDAALHTIVPDRPRLAALAAKVGLVGATVSLLVAVVLDVVEVGMLPFRAAGLPQAEAVNPVGAFFLAFVVITLVALLALLAQQRVGPLQLLRLPQRQLPSLLRDAGVGARHVLLLVAVGLLGLLVVGHLVDLLALDGLTFPDFVAGVLFLLTNIVLMAVDLILLFFLGTMVFLQADELRVGLGYRSAWEWLGVAVTAGAFALGGYRAAGATPRSTIAAALRPAGLVGPLVAAVTFPFALLWSNEFAHSNVVAIGLLLPVVWGLVALAGAWLYGAQRSLPTGIAVGSAPEGSAPEPAATPIPPAPEPAPQPPPAAEPVPAPEPPPAPPAAYETTTRLPDPPPPPDDATRPLPDPRDLQPPT
jgi:hypothetical protein